MQNPKRAKAADPAASVPGWVWFAGVMLFVAGSFQMIHGFAALERKQYFSHEIVYSNLTFWGWVFLLWGACQIIAGMLSIAGRMLGNYIGVMLAATAMILWFFMIFTTPLAAVLGVILNALVVYGLTTGAGPEWDRQAARHRE
jgi:hypothetical protein